MINIWVKHRLFMIDHLSHQSSIQLFPHRIICGLGPLHLKNSFSLMEIFHQAIIFSYLIWDNRNQLKTAFLLISKHTNQKLSTLTKLFLSWEKVLKCMDNF